MGDLSETVVSLPARRPHQDPHAVPGWRARLQRAGAGRPADVPGAEKFGGGDAARDLSQRVPRYHSAELSARSIGAVSGVVRQVPEEVGGHDDGRGSAAGALADASATRSSLRRI